MDHDAPAPAAAPAPTDRTTSTHTPPRPPVSRARKWWGTLLALVVLAALGALAWHLAQRSASGGAKGPGGGPGGRGGPATTVGVSAARQADVPVWLEALGTVTPTASVTVKPQVSGVLQQVAFREGEQVRAGQLLAVVDPRPFELALMQATGQRQRDEAQLESARVTLARYRTLLAQDSIARQEVDSQAALVKQLEGTVMTDKAAEGTARLNLAYSRVTAPVSGRVGLRAVDVGNVVSTGDANGIAVITQLSPIDVEFAVPQDQLEAVQAASNSGRPTPVAALDRTRQATLDEGVFLTLDNQIDPQTGTVRAKARFGNERHGLFPNQFVNVRLLLRTVKDAVVVPVTALRHGSDGAFVYVLDRPARTVSLRPVKRGQATVDMVAVTAGLQVGEEVITEGADRLKDGAKVTLPGDKPAMGGPGKGGKRQRGAQAGPGASEGAEAAASGASRPGKGERRRRASEAAGT